LAAFGFGSAAIGKDPVSTTSFVKGHDYFIVRAPIAMVVGLEHSK
jgi:hypothetical protein